MQQFLIDVGQNEKDYRPSYYSLSLFKEKGTILELQPGETAISPLLLATHTDFIWNISISSSDWQRLNLH